MTTRGVFRGRGAALLAATALHVAGLAAFLLGRPPEVRPLLLPPDEGVVSAMLFNASADGQGDTVMERQPLDALNDRLAQLSPALPPEGARPTTTSLDDLFGAVSAASSAPRGTSGATVKAGDPRNQVSIPRLAAATGQPCWRQGPRPLAVTMRILVDADGNLVGRPQVVRSRYPEAEAQAWRAMAGCAPYRAAPAGRYRALELDFSAPPSNWIRSAGQVTAQ